MQNPAQQAIEKCEELETEVGNLKSDLSIADKRLKFLKMAVEALAKDAGLSKETRKELQSVVDYF